MGGISVRWLEGEKIATGGIADLARARERAPWVWVDVLEPDEAALRPLAEAFGLHPLAIEDCLHYPQRPKIETYLSGLFMIWITPLRPDGEDVPTRELDVFMAADHLITVHSHSLKAIDDVVERAEDLMPRGADFVLHGIIDRLVDGVLGYVDEVADDLEDIEDVLLGSPSREHMQAIYAVRRRLVKLHRIVGPERDIIRALARERDLISEEGFRYLQDVGDHLARLEDSIETAREIASAAMDIYLSSVSNRMNEIMKALTVVATIFMPLTLLTGVYGMNVVRGMWPPVDATWSFAAVIGFMVAIIIWMMWYFRRRKWW
ncbi:MAG TPA: magnesium/cobalt transporter CorA [Coriobacteriia bacterium]|nr:magnesium/cobalt transporter CorA [Coriobacteriia bacterium]